MSHALNRRGFILTAAAGIALPGLAGARVTSDEAGAMALWYDKGAGPWVEALPVGNGRLGAMVFGRVRQERLQLNEDTLWAGSPYDPVNPAAKAALPQVRDLINQGRFKDAADLVNSAMIARPATQMPYGAAGDLFLDFKGLAEPESYERDLDLDSAIVTTRFRSGGHEHVRTVFASAPDDVIVVGLAAETPMDFDLGYRHPSDAAYGQLDYRGASTAALAVGAAWDATEDLKTAARPSDLTITEDDGALLVTGHNMPAAGIPAGLRYAVRIKAVGEGRISVVGDRLTVKGAKAVTLLISVATSHVHFADTSGDPVAKVRQATESAARKTDANLRRAHMAAHRALYRRFSIRLDAGTPDPRPTDARIASGETDDDPTLAALYVQYARYLLLSSSRPGSQPANLQGIWNEGTNPPWGGKYTININTEMNYWLASAANLPECFEPLVRMVEELSITGARTAREMYGARGWVTHHNTDLWRASAPIDGAPWGMWPTGGAWLCNTLWDHYDYSRDPALLKRLYPLLKGASQFFLDTLVEDPKGRGLVTSPSLSPENAHHDGVSICAGPAMDRQILRDLFDHTLAAHGLTHDQDAGFASQVAAARGRLPADRIGAQGQLQEWLEDWDAGAPEQTHRHVSHLYAVYPSGQINVRDTPDLIRAAQVTLNTRGDLSTGWATAWRLALWARMGEGEHAYGILKGLLGPARTYPNMFDAHPPFQIDGNFGGAAGILEMLVQSWGGEVHILPALPRAWAEGSLRGVRARGGIELDLDWRDGRLTHLLVRGRPGDSVKLRYAGTVRALVLNHAGRANLT